VRIEQQSAILLSVRKSVISGSQAFILTLFDKNIASLLQDGKSFGEKCRNSCNWFVAYFLKNQAGH
jgi:hypothetical protein